MQVVRANRDAELAKMQEFKAGLAKNLEQASKPGATGEGSKQQPLTPRPRVKS